ncbi:hypothetical protein [Actinophytocola glycyrrhizae]|uniref:Secreted protein n=1 Tax=Actinophytocola glycyrrhizae TaxID=2044873 RepID=A0ABV9RXV0_9PSEU
MAVGARVAGALPLAGATLAAVTLAGVAVFTVHQAGCADPGRYIQRDDGQVELVGSCVDPEHLSPAPNTPAEDAPAVNNLGKVDKAP